MHTTCRATLLHSKLKSVFALITTFNLSCNKFRCCKFWQHVVQSRPEFYVLQPTFNFIICHNLLSFTTLVIGQFSHTKNPGNMVSKLALDLGHIWAEENMAEVVQVENVETQDCEFISEKMSEAQRKDLCKELEKHPCLWETCGPEYKNKPRGSRALDELCQKFNISPSCLKKQLHSLRTALTREVKKETTEGHQSRWKFYTALTYMKDDVCSLKVKTENKTKLLFHHAEKFFVCSTISRFQFRNKLVVNLSLLLRGNPVPHIDVSVSFTGLLGLFLK